MTVSNITQFIRPHLNKKLLWSALTLAAIWLLLPRINLGNGYPFATTWIEVTLTCLVIIGFIAITLYPKIKQDQQVIAQIMHDLPTYIKRALKNGWSLSKYRGQQLKYKIKQDHKRRRLQRLPWFLVLGNRQSGKKQTIINTGLDFTNPEHFGEEAANYINQLPDCQWWFSERAVMIDGMTSDQEMDQQNRHRMVKLLKRERRNKPLNGMLLTLSITDLLLYSNQDRQEFVQNICHYIRDIHRHFKSHVPVYLILTKCDLIDGFMEFFTDLSREELQQVWGMTFPSNNCNNLQSVQGLFNQYYDRLTQQLNKQLMWAMGNERSQQGRELINAFPQQIQLLKQPLSTLIGELFGATRYQNILQLRGIYLTSNTQQHGTTVNFLQRALAKKFQLHPTAFQRPKRLGECYFMRGLFRHIILPEAPYLGDSERKKKRRNVAKRIVKLTCPALIAIGAIGMSRGYNQNLKNLQQIDQHIALYQTAVSGLKADDSLINTLPSLNQLQQANNIYTVDDHWGLDFLWETHRIHQQIYHAIIRSLHSLFLPRIAAQIEEQLNQNIHNQNLLYAMLKGYLAFSASNVTPESSVKAPMLYQWHRQFSNQPSTAKQLENYLNLALQQPIEKLPLDTSLINRIRGQLQQIIPSTRAYGLLNLDAKVSNYPNMLLASEVGDNFKHVFIQKNTKLTINNLYTSQGFKRIFLIKQQQIANSVAKDNQDIGLISSQDGGQTAEQISHLMQANYNRHYIHSWQQALNNISVKPFNNLPQAIQALGILSGQQSPLAALLDIIYTNSINVNYGQVQVNNYFSKVNEFARHDNEQSNWQKVVKTLAQIRHYLLTIQQAANPGEAAFTAAKATMQGVHNPIIDLTIEAQHTPKPVSQWLIAIANQSWQVFIDNAYQALNAAWNSDVMNNYSANIRGRYPLNKRAVSSVSIDTFNHFFAPNGQLNRFFKQYLSPFINTGSHPWQLLNIHGHSLELQAKTIASFARAKKIRDTYFSNGADSASLSFSIQPQILSSNASSVDLILGNQHLSYRHGPQIVSTISWPPPFNQQNATISITDFAGNQYTRSANGPWSLFKLLGYGLLKATANNGTYLLNYRFKGLNASYRITGTAFLGAFDLRLLQGFHLSEQLNTAINPQNKGSKK